MSAHQITTLYNCIKRFRLIHLVFWTAKYWSLAHLLVSKKKHHVYLAYPDAAIAILFQILSVYLVCIYLFHKFFLKKNYLLFVLYSFVTILLTSFMAVLVKDHYTRWFFIPEFHSRYLMVFMAAAMESFYVTVLFFIAYLAAHYYRKDRNHKLAEKKQLEAEVDFLKAQLNPHFVFNSLNSIYVLMDEDIPTARETLLKFCSLLRYQLYDCSVPEIPLMKELEFIDDIIELEKVRFGEKIWINYSPTHINEDVRIAPLLLIPFVENAFKHVAVKEEGISIIDIKADYKDGVFIFKVKNTFDPALKSTVTAKGIGLQNVKRRFQLLYPEKHTLDILQREEKFIVYLTIHLNGTEMPHSR